MDALKSLLELARIESNRQNARRSTGPKTEAGKVRSRSNATRHGLSGAGVALPVEAEAAVAERLDALRGQFHPANPVGEHALGRLAVATVRAERAARHEAACLATRLRHAVDDFDHAQIVDARAAMARLRSGDERARLDLLRSPEGIAHLVAELRKLRLCLAYERPVWSRDHAERLDACLGIAPDPLLPSRARALTEAALGSGALLTGPDRAAIAESGLTPAHWALLEVAAMIEGEVDALRADDAAIDRVAIEADRDEAADRALFDPLPAAQLARRYEAAAVREVDRALRLLREHEAAPADDSDPAQPIKIADGDEANDHANNNLGSAVGSFGEVDLEVVTAVAEPLAANPPQSPLGRGEVPGLGVEPKPVAIDDEPPHSPDSEVGGSMPDRQEPEDAEGLVSSGVGDVVGAA